VPAHAQPVVERQPPVNFPLILPVPLNEQSFEVGVRAGRRLGVALETPDERVRVGVSGVPLGGREGAAVAAEVEGAGPVAPRRLTIPDPLDVDARLVTVILT